MAACALTIRRTVDGAQVPRRCTYACYVHPRGCLVDGMLVLIGLSLLGNSMGPYACTCTGKGPRAVHEDSYAPRATGSAEASVPHTLRVAC